MIFVTNALTAEFVGVKIFSLETLLHIPKANYSLFGVDNLAFNLSVGVVPWPIIFILTDIINEYYGLRGVKLITWISTVLISFMFLILYIAIHLPPSDFWLDSKIKSGIPNMQYAYNAIFGQGMNIIVGSLIAFLIGQFSDALIFKKMKIWTKGKHIWLRATVSTLISQCIDSFVVTYLAFYVAQGFPFALVSSWAINAYIYKFCAALIFSPLIYVLHFGVRQYLGKDLAIKLKNTSI